MCLSCPVIWILKVQIRVVQPTREVDFTLTYNNDLDFPERGLWPCVYVFRWDEVKKLFELKLRLHTRWIHFASLGCIVRAPHTLFPEETFQRNEIVLRDLVFQQFEPVEIHKYEFTTGFKVPTSFYLRTDIPAVTIVVVLHSRNSGIRTVKRVWHWASAIQKVLELRQRSWCS